MGRIIEQTHVRHIYNDPKDTEEGQKERVMNCRKNGAEAAKAGYSRRGTWALQRHGERLSQRLGDIYFWHYLLHQPSNFQIID